MAKQTVHTLVGAVVVVIGIFAIVISHRGGPAEDASGYNIVAEFGAVDGVSIGTKVLLAGIVVGNVAQISYDEKDQRAKLDFTVENGIKIPFDSVALIVTDGLLGNKYIKIQAGGDEEMMKAGDEFEYVQGSISFEEILEKVILNAEQQRKNEKEKEEKKPKPNQASIGGGELMRTAEVIRQISNGALSK